MVTITRWTRARPVELPQFGQISSLLLLQDLTFSLVTLKKETFLSGEKNFVVNTQFRLSVPTRAGEHAVN